MVSFVINASYAIYHAVIGTIYGSVWFCSMCSFYMIFAVMRFCTVYFAKQNTKRTPNTLPKIVGIFLIALSILLGFTVFLCIQGRIAVRYHTIVMITIATYTFYKLTMAIITGVKMRRSQSAVMKALICITFAECAASVLTLQRSMLVSFGEMHWTDIHLMNALTGAGVFLFILILGIYMLATVPTNHSKGESTHVKIQTR